MTQFSPYWWQDQPQYSNDNEPPSNADIVVVGAGYTGLSAAITLAKSGASVVVLDAEDIGFGASTRNGGMLGSGHKVSTAQAIKRYGEKTAQEIHKEANSSLKFTINLIKNNNIDCELQECGRLRTAWIPKHQTDMANNMNDLKSIEHFDSHMVEKSSMHKHINTELYFGGQLYEGHAAVHPRKLHYGMLQLALDAGAKVFGGIRVNNIEKVTESFDNGFRVYASAQVISCKKVLMATNGYTRAGLSKYLARRILPVPSFIATTEDIGTERVASLLPGGNCMVETRKRFCYYRATPCGRRIMLGTRAAMHPITPQQALPTIKKMLTGIFPSMEGVGISHCWTGFTGFSFSNLPSLGEHKGVYYALGYCGNGVAMAPYLGHKAALKLLNPKKQHTVFEKTLLNTKFYYHGNPWFLPFSSVIYRGQDIIDGYLSNRAKNN